MLLQLQLQSRPSAGRDARLAMEALVGHALRSEEGADVLLLTTELVTNAYRHGAGGPISLCARRGRNGVRVEVTNDGTEGAPRPVEGGPDGGWGLQLVETISDDWGRRTLSGRTRVWFELRSPRTASRPERAESPV